MSKFKFNAEYEKKMPPPHKKIYADYASILELFLQDPKKHLKLEWISGKLSLDYDRVQYVLKRIRKDGLVTKQGSITSAMYILTAAMEYDARCDVDHIKMLRIFDTQPDQIRIYSELVTLSDFKPHKVSNMLSDLVDFKELHQCGLGTATYYVRKGHRTEDHDLNLTELQVLEYFRANKDKALQREDVQRHIGSSMDSHHCWPLRSLVAKGKVEIFCNAFYKLAGSETAAYQLHPSNQAILDLFYDSEVRLTIKQMEGLTGFNNLNARARVLRMADLGFIKRINPGAPRCEAAIYMKVVKEKAACK